MRILAFSDLHMARNRAEAIAEAGSGADLVIGAGDYCDMRRGLDDILGLLRGIEAPMVLVPGNVESAAELRAAAPDDVHVLHGESVQIDDLAIFGLGYAVPPPPFGDWSCNLSEAEAAELLGRCQRADVLISHSPPRGLGDRTGSGESVGSIAVRDAIQRLQPALALCGHVHESWGARGRIGHSEVANLGPTPNWFEIGR